MPVYVADDPCLICNPEEGARVCDECVKLFGGYYEPGWYGEHLGDGEFEPHPAAAPRVSSGPVTG